MDHGDVAWLLASTALVMLMTPGLGLFYGGMVRRKNVLSMIALCFLSLAIVSVQWIIIGYTLSFGSDIGGVIGSLEFIGLKNVKMIDYSFVVFQLVFAAITLAIITSAMAERVKLSAFLLFGILWTTLVYDPLAHWVWGNGWLAQLGALDFAGGTVVHISSGFSALALAFLIGKRSGYGEYPMEPHNIPMTLLGTALLWFGWFGFNAGSALAADEIACNAFLVTNTAAAMGALSWMFASWLKGKPGSLGMASGAVAGLVAITPAAGFVDPLSAIVIGAVAGVLCYYAMLFRVKKGIDESLDAWAVHGIGGLWGAIATGIFASVGATGLIYGNVQQFVAQIIGAVSAVIYAFVATLIIAKIVDALIGLRVSDEEEYVGLDVSQHGEVAYT
jgi:Amt family ammonium transporter